MACIQRRLQALGYPRGGNFNVENDAEVRTLVSWLEDTKIRLYPIQARTDMREGTSFAAVFSKYLTDLECPYPHGESMDKGARVVAVEWLLSHAVNLDYHDSVDTLKGLEPQTTGVKSRPQDATIALGVDDTHFRSHLEDIANVLKINPDQETPSLLRRVAQTVLEVCAHRRSKSGTYLVEKFSQEDFPLGFTTGDANLDKAATVLRLLYTQDLRNLQTSINELIASIQEHSANPKTDSRLGKVGH